MSEEHSCTSCALGGLNSAAQSRTCAEHPDCYDTLGSGPKYWRLHPRYAQSRPSGAQEAPATDAMDFALEIYARTSTLEWKAGRLADELEKWYERRVHAEALESEKAARPSRPEAPELDDIKKLALAVGQAEDRFHSTGSGTRDERHYAIALALRSRPDATREADELRFIVDKVGGGTLDNIECGELIDDSNHVGDGVVYIHGVPCWYNTLRLAALSAPKSEAQGC